MKSFKEFIDEMMVTGSTGDAAGFSEKSRKEGPTAGLSAPFMQGMVTRSNKTPWIKPAIAQSKKRKKNETV
mgnify:FL=1|tara:strand:+ start:303 stop:515 length:213 start_codon:yes stop_codon:yes gene_type:complete